MKKYLAFLLVAVFLICSLSACGATAKSSDDSTLTIAATTYPVYCFASAVTQGVEGVEVEQIVTDSVSCLHNYTLTVSNMRLIEGADVIALSGAGLEDFMDDALAASKAPVIDCSKDITLLPGKDGESDPHIWLDPARAAQMVENLATRLAEIDPDHADAYLQNAENTAKAYNALGDTLRQKLEGLTCRDLITFHDGFAYFAEALDLNILCSIEEEEGSEASAEDISGIISLVKEHQLPAIFCEVNGSDATAQAISRETGAGVYALSTLMSVPADWDTEGYEGLMTHNVEIILQALGGT